LNSLILVVPLEELGWDLKNEKFKDNAPPDFSKVKDKYPGSSEARPSTPEE
jgi:hypothetical protein